MTYLNPAWHLLANRIGGMVLTPPRVRRLIYRLAGLRLDPSVRVRPGVFFYGPQVAIGEGSFVNRGTWFHAVAPITVGARCLIGNEVHFSAMTHEPGDHRQRGGQLRAEPITVGDGVWIGSRTTILAGVTIGEGCIVGAGAVVTGDCAPDGLYTGVPAVRKRDLQG